MNLSLMVLLLFASILVPGLILVAISDLIEHVWNSYQQTATQTSNQPADKRMY